jgi:hypothetical protein
LAPPASVPSDHVTVPLAFEQLAPAQPIKLVPLGSGSLIDAAVTVTVESFEYASV